VLNYNILWLCYRKQLDIMTKQPYYLFSEFLPLKKKKNQNNSIPYTFNENKILPVKEMNQTVEEVR